MESTLGTPGDDTGTSRVEDVDRSLADLISFDLRRAKKPDLTFFSMILQPSCEIGMKVKINISGS